METLKEICNQGNSLLFPWYQAGSTGLQPDIIGPYSVFALYYVLLYFSRVGANCVHSSLVDNLVVGGGGILYFLIISM